LISLALTPLVHRRIARHGSTAAFLGAINLYTSLGIMLGLVIAAHLLWWLAIVLIDTQTDKVVAEILAGKKHAAR
jgi:hypothetical protein